MMGDFGGIPGTWVAWERLGSAGHDPVLIYFFALNVQKSTRNELLMPNVTDFIIGFSILKKS